MGYAPLLASFFIYLYFFFNLIETQNIGFYFFRIFTQFLTKVLIMLAVRGIFENGEIKLLTPVKSEKKVEVIITFLEDVKSENDYKLDFSKFSFGKVRELLKDYVGNLSDAVIEERRYSL